MTRGDIIRMAKWAGWKRIGRNPETGPEFPVLIGNLERFAALVAAAERERMKSEGWRQCAKGQRTTQYCGLLEDSVKAEREECARVCEDFEDRENPYERNVAVLDCAAAIRARGD